MKVLHEKCDPKLAEDKKLPYTAYLIEYVDKENGEEKTFYDIATCLKQTAGIVNPKLWNPESDKKTPPAKPSQRKRK